MHAIFFLSDMLFTSCYFTCTCLVLEISLFGSIIVKQKQKHRSKFFIFGIQIHIWIGSAHHESIRKVPWWTRNHFRILNRHYLKIVGNNKLWLDMQKRKLKYSLNENFSLLPYVEWDRFVTLTGAQAEWGLRYRI